jgi:hypothetical protein
MQHVRFVYGVCDRAAFSVALSVHLHMSKREKALKRVKESPKKGSGL